MIIDTFKKNSRHFLEKRAWFLRRITGLSAGIFFKKDYLDAGLPMPSLIFDVGAHRGETCNRFRNDFPEARIIAFEPVKENFNALSVVATELSNIECVHSALGAKTEELLIYLQSDSQTHSLRHHAAGSTPTGTRTETIRVVTLDEFAILRAIDTIDLLKIDTEGTEIDVLHGAKGLLSERRIASIFLEATLDPADTVHTSLNSAVSFLQPFGYELVSISDQVIWDNPPRLAYFNAFFAQRQPSPQ